MENLQKNKNRIYGFCALWLIALVLWKIGASYGFVVETKTSENIWWSGLLLFGAMITGFIFQPLVKRLFPAQNDPRVVENPKLHLKDHETLMGYYPVVALVVLLGFVIISYSDISTINLFEIKNANFWWSALTTGVLNVFIFYFLTKGIRYGDMSLVSITWSVAPIIALPISFIAYRLVGKSAGISSPDVTFIGFIGIILTVFALSFNVVIEARKKAKKNILAPVGDWFAHHPVLSGLLASTIAAFAVNLDKISVDTGNPFLAGIIMALVVTIVTSLWTTKVSGFSRIVFLFKEYWKQFLIVGLAYGAIILVMNFTLLGHNVNYYAAIKRSAGLFGTIYGIYVLKEGLGSRDKISRLLVSVAVIAGIILIIWKG